MGKRPFISLIGSGNVAWHLGPELDNHGYFVAEVYSRSPDHARQLSKRLYQARQKDDLDFSNSQSEIFVIATSDDSIEGIAKEIVLPENAILLHTSGGQPLEVLEFAAIEKIGVFYPLQTFSKGKNVDFKNIPICIQTSDKEVESIMLALANDLSKEVVVVDANGRKTLHLAAVFACNFTNHMLTIANDITDKSDLDFDLLKPLIIETLDKALTIGPSKSQTGPAIRQDFQTIQNHIRELENYIELKSVYNMITQNIIDRYS